MKAILLAAGKGTRISRKIGNIPKSLIDINGEPLILKTIRMLKENLVDISVVLGYKKHLFDEYTYVCKVYYNPFYSLTNSIASLWFAKDEIDGTEDIIIANADVFWDENVLRELLNSSEDVLMLYDSSRKEEGDYLFKVEGNVLIEHGKELEDPSGEYVGVSIIRKKFQKKFRERLESLIDNENFSLWWENVLYSFIGERDIYVKDISGLFWGEVDYLEDYYRILRYIDKRSE
ncbi:cholinephosphate cytidylyltransferase [Thermosipho melanesiensis]|uniref:Sugar nucleotidyltransferase-like protein n=2 Tax=Thermosipho melanesiensis TaxID=46541 RepID=A6LLD1_THEM4|nr:phosphocholine cytidylyltransferase family protein [Thermosipho melanesiensis]ABR30732.1 sugar nucleotidyltransferase-like protein [Thermosipho melanesiensis BI429]APT73858.1 cholinephosphate cytidylyltransferase [Thermosipho melanesiensis]OOC35799.1 cholinephosphate cytidylyltransferase [Thermosipho melanesiensis]OOC38301.1 cholinephosphate cytidylyltransferase [Thermosipho melanesiensis]OOC38762.1 cholinephosphate cytidylyltransferase [Thermosipho melanesiensis]